MWVTVNFYLADGAVERVRRLRYPRGLSVEVAKQLAVHESICKLWGPEARWEPLSAAVGQIVGGPSGLVALSVEIRPCLN